MRHLAAAFGQTTELMGPDGQPAATNAGSRRTGKFTEFAMKHGPWGLPTISWGGVRGRAQRDEMYSASPTLR